MSRWLDHADALAVYLIATVPYCATSVAEADRIAVTVDRKLDIASRISQVAGKARGGAIAILFTGAKNPDPKARTLRTGGTYTIFVMTRPTQKDAIVTCDDLTEAVAEAVHGWVPVDTPNAHTQRLEVTDIDLAPHKALMIYEITAQSLRLGLASASPVGDWDADAADWED